MQGRAFALAGRAVERHITSELMAAYGRRRRTGLAGSTCSPTPRLIRGGAGFLIGGAIGSLIGGILAARMVANVALPEGASTAASAAASMPFLDDLFGGGGLGGAQQRALSVLNGTSGMNGFSIGAFFGVGVGIPLALATIGAFVGARKPTC